MTSKIEFSGAVYLCDNCGTYFIEIPKTCDKCGVIICPDCTCYSCEVDEEE